MQVRLVDVLNRWVEREFIPTGRTSPVSFHGPVVSVTLHPSWSLARTSWAPLCSAVVCRSPGGSVLPYSLP